MNKKTQAGFRKRLLELQEALTAVNETARDAADVVELDQTRVGRLSRMDAMQSQAMSIATNRRREMQLRKIDAALRRIDNGDYGRCLKCDVAINPKRLAFDPAATRCIDCADNG